MSTIVSTTTAMSMQATMIPSSVTAASPLFDGPDRRGPAGSRQRRAPVSRWACAHVGRALLGGADHDDGPAQVVQEPLRGRAQEPRLDPPEAAGADHDRGRV